jgi:nitroimidazol reductase NimA-like FMN-containing flavoprotein (pyridoxamine 5'-phosphate oxidase superfamily)
MSDATALSYDECLGLLQAEAVGRIAVLADPYPLIFPVNYRLVEFPDGRAPGHTWIAIRTRPGNTIDRAPTFVSFEIDGVDHAHRTGWSVLVAGTLHAVDPGAAEFRARFDTNPWLDADRERWLVIHPARITGRRVGEQQVEWAFSALSYL